MKTHTPMSDDDFADAVESENSPSAKRIQQLERELSDCKIALAMLGDKHEREIAEASKNRDRLAEALRKLDDLGPPSKARSIIYDALAAVKGEFPPVE